MRTSKIKIITLCALFSVLSAVGAFIKIPFPLLPFTMQTFFVALAGLLLGKKYGFISIMCYLVLGLVGFPVFTKGGGPSYIFQPSFGYIIGFALSAYVIGAYCEKKQNPTFKTYFIGCILGLCAVYAVGLAYYYIICNYVINTPIAVGPLFLYCFLMTLPSDIMWALVASSITNRLKKAVKIDL